MSPSILYVFALVLCLFVTAKCFVQPFQSRCAGTSIKKQTKINSYPIHDAAEDGKLDEVMKLVFEDKNNLKLVETEGICSFFRFAEHIQMTLQYFPFERKHCSSFCCKVGIFWYGAISRWSGCGDQLQEWPWTDITAFECFLGVSCFYCLFTFSVDSNISLTADTLKFQSI